MTDSNRVPNHLSEEKSPYLLQHIDNPVDWFPWGEQAFEKAKREDKPVFLSIGYSTCHWCHVMAHESFEDPKVAAVMNEHFVCVKVDREERPDVDAVYMAVCQAMTGSGGWPLTILMTPQQRPFWAGTYLPKIGGPYGRTGLLELLGAIVEQWNTNRDQLLVAGDQIAAYLQEQAASAPDGGTPGKELLQAAMDQFRASYDQKWGGFGGAPKFPAPHNLLLLLRISLLEQDQSARTLAEHTLVQMYRGGLFDHIGGGFSRYSTDAKWLVPHFEKMLYDNALLADAYAQAYVITKNPLYGRVARRTLDYVLRELTDEQGSFYCGQDADSDGVEGKFYLFTPQEIHQVLGEADGDALCSWFGVTEQGNFDGANILNLIENPDYAQENPRMDDLCRRLYAYRLTRTSLHKDDKVLTAWNALMIAALAKAGSILDEPDYLHAAQRAQRFLEQNLVDARGRLLLRWREGEAAHDGQLDDYAFYALALLELYRATFDVSYLRRAADIAEQMTQLFFDPERGGFYLYAGDSEQLISRPKEVYDGAMPSGNSAAAVALLLLSSLTGEEKWRVRGELQLHFLTGWVKDYPMGYGMALSAISRAVCPSQELICTAKNAEHLADLQGFLRENSLPNLTVLIKTEENQEQLSEISPFTAEYPVPQDAVLYFLCRNGACAAPVDSLEKIKKMLEL